MDFFMLLWRRLRTPAGLVAWERQMQGGCCADRLCRLQLDVLLSWPNQIISVERIDLSWTEIESLSGLYGHKKIELIRPQISGA
jgi:hypothetical protein